MQGLIQATPPTVFPVGRAHSKPPLLATAIMAALTKTASSPTKNVGPDYRPESKKPIATVSVEVPFENVHTLAQTPQLIALLTWVLVR